LVDKELADFVVEVRHKSDRIMAIKVLVGEEIINVVSVYALQIGLPIILRSNFERIRIWSFRMYLGAKNFS